MASQKQSLPCSARNRVTGVYIQAASMSKLAQATGLSYEGLRVIKSTGRTRYKCWDIEFKG